VRSLPMHIYIYIYVYVYIYIYIYVCGNLSHMRSFPLYWFDLGYCLVGGCFCVGSAQPQKTSSTYNKKGSGGYASMVVIFCQRQGLLEEGAQ
jgi:hypothetical protein